MRFRTALLTMMLALIVPLPQHSGFAETPVPAFDGQTTSINVSLEVSGLRTAVKVDEEVCAFGFPLLIETPILVVTTGDGDIVSVTPLGAGDRHEENGVIYCSQNYEINVPVDDRFRVEIAPYFTGSYAADDIHGESEISIVVHREEGDPFPLSPLPSGGPVEGTDNILVVGRFELYGSQFEDFITDPLVGCMGSRGYDDVQAGMQITIKDETGTIIGLAELIPDPTEDMTEHCQFYFKAELPQSSFYTFESGRHGGITVSHDDIVSDDYEVSLTLGR